MIDKQITLGATNSFLIEFIPFVPKRKKSVYPYRLIVFENANKNAQVSAWGLVGTRRSRDAGFWKSVRNRFDAEIISIFAESDLLDVEILANLAALE